MPRKTLKHRSPINLQSYSMLFAPQISSFTAISNDWSCVSTQLRLWMGMAFYDTIGSTGKCMDCIHCGWYSCSPSLDQSVRSITYFLRTNQSAGHLRIQTDKHSKPYQMSREFHTFVCGNSFDACQHNCISQVRQTFIGSLQTLEMLISTKFLLTVVFRFFFSKLSA